VRSREVGTLQVVITSNCESVFLIISVLIVQKLLLKKRVCKNFIRKNKFLKKGTRVGK